MARIFLLKGDIANPGYVDIPEEATTIREVIYEIGGGIPNGRKFKAVQIAGMDVGERLTLEGRVQSRTYTKLLETGSEERTAFEVSIMQLLEEEEAEETAP